MPTKGTLGPVLLIALYFRCAYEHSPVTATTMHMHIANFAGMNRCILSVWSGDRKVFTQRANVPCAGTGAGGWSYIHKQWFLLTPLAKPNQTLIKVLADQNKKMQDLNHKTLQYLYPFCFFNLNLSLIHTLSPLLSISLSLLRTLGFLGMCVVNNSAWRMDFGLHLQQEMLCSTEQCTHTKAPNVSSEAEIGKTFPC